MIGVVDTTEAQRLAREAGLDLVEVNPKAYPPVCKIMDFGKFKYEEKKRTRDAKKRQTVIELKEIKLRPKTDDHDLNFKLKHIKRFLDDGNKVKITCRFRGREITHPETAQAQLDYIRQQTLDVAIVELTPRMEGRTMTLLLAPAAAKVVRPRPAAPDADDKPRAAPAPARAPVAAPAAPVAAPVADAGLDDEDEDDDDDMDDADIAEAADKAEAAEKARASEAPKAEAPKAAAPKAADKPKAAEKPKAADKPKVEAKAKPKK